MSRSWRLGFAVAILAALALGAADGVMAQPGPTLNVGSRLGTAAKLSPGLVLRKPGDLSQALTWNHPTGIFGTDGIVTDGSRIPPARVMELSNLASQRQSVSRKTEPFVSNLTKVKNQGVIKGRRYELSKELIGSLKALSLTADIDYVESVARGEYFVQFRYSIIRPADVKLPLRFHLYLEGPAHPFVGWIPFVHASGPADNVQAHVIAVMIANNPPLTADATAVGVTAVDADGNSLGVFKKSFNLTFWKRYDDITRDNIRDYINSPGRARSQIPLVGAGDTLLSQQIRFYSEPALLLMRTNQGNFVKALVKIEIGAGNYHLAIWDARCYARDQATFDSWPFMASGSPSNTEYLQLFGRGGYIFNTWGFDFDRDGENYAAGSQDVWIENVSGPSTEKLLAQNGAVIAW